MPVRSPTIVIGQREMRIRMTRSIVGQGLRMLPGEEYDVAEGRAIALIQAGYAVAVAQWPPNAEKR